MYDSHETKPGGSRTGDLLRMDTSAFRDTQGGALYRSTIQTSTRVLLAPIVERVLSLPTPVVMPAEMPAEWSEEVKASVRVNIARTRTMLLLMYEHDMRLFGRMQVRRSKCGVFALYGSEKGIDEAQRGTERSVRWVLEKYWPAYTADENRNVIGFLPARATDKGGWKYTPQWVAFRTSGASDEASDRAQVERLVPWMLKSEEWLRTHNMRAKLRKLLDLP